MALNIPGFPASGPIGAFAIQDGGNSGANAGTTVGLDNAVWTGGYVLISILAEMRVQTAILADIANARYDLKTLRADAVADMGTLYQANASAPIPSS